MLGHHIVFVASAALAQELCDEKRFHKAVTGPIVEIRYSVNSSLFTAYHHEEGWGVAHRIIAPKLSQESVAELFDHFVTTTEELVAKWTSVDPDTPIQPLKDLNRLSFEATVLSLYGMKVNNINGPEHPVIQAMEDATSEAMKRPTRPKLLNWLVYGRKFKKATKVMRDFAAEVVKHRREHPCDRHDLLWALMNGKDPETGKGLTDNEIIDEIVTMPIGSSTAPCVIAACIYYLIHNPAVVAKAREEIDTVLSDEPFRHDHLPQLHYIMGVVRETLRLSCAAPGFNIEPIPKEGGKSPVLLAGGKYSVPHNQTMIIVLAGVNRDPAVFEDPEAFKPERMMCESFAAMPEGVKKFFGNGMRECIGKNWALDWLMVVTTLLIRSFDFEAADKNYEFMQDGWFNIRPIDFYIRVKPRQKEVDLKN